MRRFMSVLSVACAFAVMACDSGTTVPFGVQEVKSSLTRNFSPATENVTALTAGNMDFGFDLYHELAAENEGDNIFISGHSVSIALAMAYAGAKGDTATQMEDVLHFPMPGADVLESFNALDLELDRRGTEDLLPDEDGDPFELSVVNQAWGRIGFEFLDTYLDSLALNFGAGMRLMDFAGNPDGSVVIIHDCVAEQTMDRIKNLLPEGSISAATALVLTNAIYFKASWLDKFDPANTYDTDFNLPDGTKVTVKMMSKYDELRYMDGDGFEYLEIPYVGDNVAMVLVLPESGNFDTVEASLDGESFAAMTQDATLAAGDVRLPRFTFEFESTLNFPLMDLGMVDAFAGGSADFSGIDGRPGNLFISLVVHKSFVAVDEEGTEAAAATAVVMDNGSVPADTFDLTFDRPFIFAIVDKPSGAVLFLGRVLDPSAS